MIGLHVAKSLCQVTEEKPWAALDARAVANRILDVSSAYRPDVYVTTLLKLLYFAHGWHLAVFNRPLVGQAFEAWQHGPVIRVVYDQIKQHSRSRIVGRLKTFSPTVGEYVTATANIPKDSDELLKSVVKAYGDFHPYTLSDMTHDTGSPWHAAWVAAENGLLPGARIDNGAIRNYFLTLNASDMLRS